MSITFYCFPKGPNEPSPSGYCQKLETFFRATNYTNYTLKYTLAHTAPKGKLPYIEISQLPQKPTTTTTPTGVADSHFIIKHLIENKIVPDPDESLTAAQRGDTRAWQAWTEELIYPTVVYQRWCVPSNYYVTRSILPGSWLFRWALGWYLEWNIRKAMWAHGVGRHTDEERLGLTREYVESLEGRLEGVEFFHGSEPTLVDIIIYGFLANAINQKGNPEYLALVLGSERVKRYTAVLTRRWFPEYEGILEIVEKSHSD